MRLATVAIVIGLCMACQGKAAGTLPSARAGLRLTTPQVARQLSRQSLRVDIPFGLTDQGVNGTGVLFGFLQRMETYRAAYVSDLSYSLQMTYNGMAIECVSKIRVDDGTPEATPPAAAEPEADGEIEYMTNVKAWRPRTTDAWVNDREMVCEKHAQLVKADRPLYETSYDVQIARTNFGVLVRNPADTTAIVQYDECTYRPSRRFVHRYEHFIAARFTPPDLAVIARSYADMPLVAEPPLCHQIQLAPGQQLRQHINADVHFPAEIVPHLENLQLPQRPVRSVGGES